MKELKTLIIVLIFVGVTYWGIEPFAHSQLNPSVAPANFDFAAEDTELAKSNLKTAQKSGNEKAVAAAQASLELYEQFWAEVNAIDLNSGDATRGQEFVMGSCVACHNIKSQGVENGMSAADLSEAYGVVPPDLSEVGYLYDKKFLAALIKNPAVALKVSHKFNDENPHPMTSYAAMENEAQEIADIVAYFASIAPQNLTNKEAFIAACARCHDIRYDNVFVEGNRQRLQSYLGMAAPDLSMYIRSRSAKHLRDFINDPQKLIPGTAMPRVGLTKEVQAQVVSYLEEVGDPKKAERDALGYKVALYFVILWFFAWLWKRKVWRDLH